MRKGTIISLFTRVQTKDPMKRDLYKLLKLTMKNDYEYKDEITAIRQLYKSDPEAYKRRKQELPVITVSGNFAGSRSDSLQTHSGYICIDIDGKDNPHITDYDDLKRQLANICNVDYCGLSVRGKGLFVLVKIPPEPENHKKYFNALMRCFTEMGIVIDHKCDNLDRKRFISYDPDAFIREGDAVPFTQMLDHKPKREVPATKEKATKKTLPKSLSKPSGEKDTLTRVEEIITKIEENCIDITEDRDDWIRIGFALANEFGESGRDMFHRISRFHDKYDENESDSQYNSFLNSQGAEGSVTIGTFFHLAKEHGVL